MCYDFSNNNHNNIVIVMSACRQDFLAFLAEYNAEGENCGKGKMFVSKKAGPTMPYSTGRKMRPTWPRGGEFFYLSFIAESYFAESYLCDFPKFLVA